MVLNNNELRDNTSIKEIYLDDERLKIWLGNDGIIRAWVSELWKEESFTSLINKFAEIYKKIPPSSNILADAKSVKFIPSLSYRPELTNVFKEVYKKTKFKKIAVWGVSITLKVMLSFVLSVTRLKNVKAFNTEEEALKWLKEE